MRPSIVVVGSSNTDMVIRAKQLPAPGETIVGGKFFMNAGGKGANQAVAAARLNGQVTFITKVGDDVFGRTAVQSYKNEGINTDHISTDAHLPSGVALITVDDNAENCIVVAPGANAALHAHDIERAAALFASASVILVQLEIPLDTVKHVVTFAAKNNVPLLLNPAPAFALPDDLLGLVSVITPNKKEAEMLTGLSIINLDTARQAAAVLAGKGIKKVIITLGAEGALLLTDNGYTYLPAVRVTPVDTTAAGDVFNGALAVAVAEEQDIEEAIKFASHAAAISVTRLGAQASAPRREEVEELMKRSKV